MLRNSRILVVAPFALTALLLSGCSASSAGPEQPAAAPAQEVIEPLDATKAGGIYLGAICPVNEAWDAVDVEVDRLRIAVGRDSAEVDTTHFAEAMQQVSDASKRAGDALKPKGKSWPEAAAPLIAKVQDSLAADQKEALVVAKLDAADAVSHEWENANSAAKVSAKARKALELPKDSVAACDQWREQNPAAAEADPEPTDDKPAGKSDEKSSEKPSEKPTKKSE